MNDLEILEALVSISSSSTLMDTVQNSAGLDTSCSSSSTAVDTQSTLDTLGTSGTCTVINPLSSKTTKKKQFTCPDCSKQFTQQAHLQIHMRKHTGERPFHCSFPNCFKSFTQLGIYTFYLGNLKTHERKHTGERPFTCPFCFKSFSQMGNLKTHEQLHLGVRPYLCEVLGCGKRFTQLGNLKSHQIKVHSSNGSTTSGGVTKKRKTMSSPLEDCIELDGPMIDSLDEHQLLKDLKAVIDKNVNK
jgi:uncharacterized Zn-finger protein